jgi:hypothetical protein
LRDYSMFKRNSWSTVGALGSFLALVGYAAASSSEQQASALEDAREGVAIFIEAHGKEALEACVGLIAVKVSCHLAEQLESLLAGLPGGAKDGLGGVDISGKQADAYRRVADLYGGKLDVNIPENTGCNNKRMPDADCEQIEKLISVPKGKDSMLQSTVKRDYRQRSTGQTIFSTAEKKTVGGTAEAFQECSKGSNKKP